jgi:putative nucleotidyltransferase with HDIG domain
MKLNLHIHIFTSRFARKIFFIFFLCALIPVGGLAVIAYHHVGQQLEEQFRTRLKRSVKSYSLFLYERFLILETEMTLAASHLSKPNQNFSESIENSYLKRLQKRFTAMVLFKTTEGSLSLFGRIGAIESFNEKERSHLQAGKQLVKIVTSSGGQPDLLMITLVESKKPRSGILVAKINPVYLLALDNEYHLPVGIDVLLRDESQKIFHSSFAEDYPITNYFSQKGLDKSSGYFEFDLENDSYLACFRWLFMEPAFLFSGFNITFIQSKTNVFLAIVEFKKIFPQVIILSLLVIIGLSIHFIHTSLEPLEILKEGTRQIAGSNFNHRVAITSRDEFEKLGEAFNQMAVQLKDQFNELETNALITRSVLSSLETQKILDTVISGMTDCFSCESVTIGRVNGEQPDRIQCYVADGQAENRIRRIDCELRPSDIKRFDNSPEFLIIRPNPHQPEYLSTVVSDGIAACLVLPIFLDANLSTIIAMAYRNLDDLNHDRLRARQMANQVAVALSNSKLMEQLDQLNWGTLRALGRTVDAKSAWTAGHSGRVTRLALELADTLIPDRKQRENLHRAGLLHDIGKLGVPVDILDKPGKLSDQEYEIMKAHPQTGARILEPIKEYKVLIPMVLQHHEHFDGKGYPHGLSGNAINFGARILAVADSYDAMISDRPYRDGLPLERVIEILQEESGRQFDPVVVEALINHIYRKASKAA